MHTPFHNTNLLQNHDKISLPAQCFIFKVNHYTQGLNPSQVVVIKNRLYFSKIIAQNPVSYAKTYCGYYQQHHTLSTSSSSIWTLGKACWPHCRTPKEKRKKKNTKKTTVLTLLGEGFAQDPGGVKMFPDGFLSLVSRFWIQILG